MKYTSPIYNSVKDYFLENFNETITDYEIDYEMSVEDVMKYYFEWEGILGYNYMFNIFLRNYHEQESAREKLYDNRR